MWPNTVERVFAVQVVVLSCSIIANLFKCIPYVICALLSAGHKVNPSSGMQAPALNIALLLALGRKTTSYNSTTETESPLPNQLQRILLLDPHQHQAQLSGRPSALAAVIRIAVLATVIRFVATSSISIIKSMTWSR
eukprot:scaffold18325_cov110-Skeletonema_marinoi.AAC.2